MGKAVIVNLLPMSVFALQHGLIARNQCKRWWTQVLPKSVARSAYLLSASIALVLLLWQWRPTPTVIWHVEFVLGAAIASLVCILRADARGVRSRELA
jgi:protein-S-isoprenylcysteine O-methyltransferase Ste14